MGSRRTYGNSVRRADGARGSGWLQVDGFRDGGRGDAWAEARLVGDVHVAVQDLLQVAQETAGVHQVAPGLEIDEEVDVAALRASPRATEPMTRARDAPRARAVATIASRRLRNSANVGGGVPGEYFEQEPRVG